MTATDLAPQAQSHQALSVKGRSKRGKVTGKIADAIERMIELNEPWDNAAVNAGLTVRAMRLALLKPHVLQHIKARREVFRVTVCAGNIHALRRARDHAPNMVSVNAARALEYMGNEQQATGASAQSPGLVIIVNAGAVTGHQPQIEGKPLIEHASVTHAPNDMSLGHASAGPAGGAPPGGKSGSR